MSYACLSLSDVLCDCALHSLVFHPVLPAVTQRSETVGCLQGKILKASRFPPGAPSRIKNISQHLPQPLGLSSYHRERWWWVWGGLFLPSLLFTLVQTVNTPRACSHQARCWNHPPRVFWLQLPSADCTARRIQESRGRLSLPANYRLRNMELGYPLMAIVRMITTLTCFLRALVLVAQG